MAGTIILPKKETFPIVIGNNQQSGTPIRMDSSIDWAKISAIVSDNAKSAVNEMAIDEALAEAVDTYDVIISTQLQSIIG